MEGLVYSVVGTLTGALIIAIFVLAFRRPDAYEKLFKIISYGIAFCLVAYFSFSLGVESTIDALENNVPDEQIVGRFTFMWPAIFIGVWTVALWLTMLPGILGLKGDKATEVSDQQRRTNEGG